MSLPDKPSRLIHTALSDLRWIEADPRYKVHMGQWHSGYSGKGFPPCYVCLAGAVMARSLHSPLHQELTPMGFPDDVRRKLLALDNFRNGYIDAGVRLMGLEMPPGLPVHVKVPGYHRDGVAGFKRGIREVQQLLENVGL